MTFNVEFDLAEDVVYQISNRNRGECISLYYMVEYGRFNFVKTYCSSGQERGSKKRIKMFHGNVRKKKKIISLEHDATTSEM